MARENTPMQLSTIHNPDKAWHITTIKAYNQIKLNGGILTGGNTPNYGKVGPGVYISIPENNQNIKDHLYLWTEYLDINDPIYLKVTINLNTCLMDEDALEISINQKNIEDYRPIFGTEAGTQINNLAKNTRILDNDQEIKNECLKIIDEYQIKPHNKFKIWMGHECLGYSARSPKPIKIIKAYHKL